jgi:hypothetical protein
MRQIPMCASTAAGLRAEDAAKLRFIGHGLMENRRGKARFALPNSFAARS